MKISPRESWPNTPQLQRYAYAALAVVCIGNLMYSLSIGGLDFSVYRSGAMTIFHNEGFDKELYVIDLLRLGPDFALPFTYPPFAALLFLPFAFLPQKVGIFLMMILAYAVAWWVATLIYNYVQKRGRTLPLQHRLGRYGTIALLAAIILLSGPWRRGLGLVQINPLIMLLVLWDFIRPATRIPRGLFIGIAGGIKLTPLAFGLILLMRKDFKGVITLGASFFITIIIGFIFLPQEAIEFWTSAVSDPSRVGNTNYLDNISIQGWLMHFGLSSGILLKVLHYGLIALLMAGTAWLIYRLEQRQLLISQIALNAFLMVSISPISWSHHNTWLPLLAIALWADAFPLFIDQMSSAVRMSALVFSWVGVVGLYISPMWIGIAVHGSLDRLEDIAPLGLILSAIPITALFSAVLLWIYSSLKTTNKPLV
ncbi:glycosyltransferase family 87 protein [Rothia sp. CCM 9418]|uniref:glycosyltransferase family 87 protein n=1 Tax=Rothia sp. CCM 9418 TaxID=3402661 RepID=UPI003AED929E